MLVGITQVGLDQIRCVDRLIELYGTVYWRLTMGPQTSLRDFFVAGLT